MLKNYWRIAWRTIARNKIYTTITRSMSWVSHLGSAVALSFISSLIMSSVLIGIGRMVSASAKLRARLWSIL